MSKSNEDNTNTTGLFFKRFYTVKGDGVAHMKVDEAVKSQEFKESVRKLATAKILVNEKAAKKEAS